MPTNTKLRLFTIAEAAEAYPGLTRHRIRELVINRQLKAIMAGKKYLILQQEIEKYLLKNGMSCGII
ncbi:hypothetical protein FACS1894202_10400 [Clostridia bacterium]|nr:hypothetical protein FACS1894202_10400 [Clostridia bacterium]